jgi:hypothetical protein
MKINKMKKKKDKKQPKKNNRMAGLKKRNGRKTKRS